MNASIILTRACTRYAKELADGDVLVGARIENRFNAQRLRRIVTKANDH
jgi:hypothetical protein